MFSGTEEEKKHLSWGKRCWLETKTLTGASAKREGSPEEELMSRSSVCSCWDQVRPFFSLGPQTRGQSGFQHH